VLNHLAGSVYFISLLIYRLFYSADTKHAPVKVDGPNGEAPTKLICEKCSKDPNLVPVCNPRPRSIFYAKKGQPAKALRAGCDAHFVPVRQSTKFEACDPALAEYYELVSKNDLVVPLGVLWLEKASSGSIAVDVIAASQDAATGIRFVPESELDPLL
jgi:hypothetical protein